MAEIDVLKAQIVRQDLSPWGFRLQGGAEHGAPIKILRLTPGSPAARIGLKPGDDVTEVGDTPTEGLTYQQVLDLIGQYGDTLLLTVERRAKGTVPANPVLARPDQDPLKSYQTYDMSGGKPAPSSSQGRRVRVRPTSSVAELPPADSPVNYYPFLVTGSAPKPEKREAPKLYQTFDMNGPKAPLASAPKHNFQFQTVTSRPFVEDTPKPMYENLVSPPAPAPQPPSQYEHDQYQQYSEDPMYTDDSDSTLSQSRTFKVLESLMSSEEPAAGVPGLPPQRSIAQELWKAEQNAKRGSPRVREDEQNAMRGSPRVRVFMPQQYNSPMGMYSAKNVVETFQAQAETVMDAMDRESYDVSSSAVLDS